MLIPEHFAEKDRSTLYDWIERWSFGTLMTSHRGRLEANPMPFVLDRDKHQLLGCMERSNKHWMTLFNAEDVLVQFNGPSSYISPLWSRQPGDGAPVWNHLVVQVRGRPELVKTESESIYLLQRLTQAGEALNQTRWNPEILDENILKEQCQAWVCFRIPVSQLEGRAVLGQNRSRADRISVARELAASEDSRQQELARLMMLALKQEKKLTQTSPEA